MHRPDRRRHPDVRLRRIALAAFATFAVANALPRAALAQLEPPHRPIRFERAAVEPFLPQSSVYVIHQDRRGYLWFATREGLGRWDGAEMRTWKATPFDSSSIPNNVVRRLVEDRDGNLWVAAQPSDDLPLHVARIVAPDHSRVQRFSYEGAIPFLDRDRVAWIVDGDSLRRFDGVDRFVAMAPRLGSGDPRGAYMDRSGTIWVSDQAGAAERYGVDAGATYVRPATPAPFNRDAPGISAFFEDDRGTLWVFGTGLRRLDAARERIVVPEGLPAPLDTVGTIGMLQDPDGWLWMATLDGVYRLDPALATVERYSLRLPGNIQTQNWTLGLARDSSGAIWAGTVWGLHRYDPAADVFGFLEHDPTDPNTIGSGLVLALHEDRTGSIWVGTLGGGLNRIDRRTGAVRRFRRRPGSRDDLGHDWVWRIVDAGGGRVWVALADGLALIDPSSGTPVRRFDAGIDRSIGVQVLHAQDDGGLWIGSRGKLLHRASNGVVRSFGSPTGGSTSAILPDGDDLWIATAAGLARFDPETGASRVFRHEPARPRSLSTDVVISLLRDHTGRLWVGTDAGLDRLDPDSGFTHFGAANGFPSSVIYSILEDDDARLWLATNRGLVRFDPAAPDAGRTRIYGPASGVGNVEFNRNASLRGRDGTLYFGGDRGVTFFQPSSLRDNPYRPPVVVTALHRSTRQGTSTSQYVDDGPIVLAPDDYTVTFELAALAFTQPSRNRFAYRLDGFDANWIDAGTNRRASYTNLPPGDYTFRARAANEDGLWNMDGIALPVVVRPWFWETWWFRAAGVAAVLLAVAAGTTLVQRSRHRHELETLRHQRALEDERARISRDMHDEVGASLTEIAILSELAVRRDQRNGARRSELEKIAGRSRAMLDAIGEIIWALNPEHDPADHLASYLREHAAAFLESTGLRSELTFETSPAAGPLTSDFRRNVFLILKESLANVAKHAHARTVRIDFDLDDERLVLTVADDGIGFVRIDSGGAHHGLSNLERRARSLGGSLAIERAPAGGTRVRLDVPLPGGVHAGEP